MADETTAESAQPIAEISHGPSALEKFLDRNQKVLIAVGIVAALGIGTAVVIRGIEEGARKDGGMDLVAASDLASLQDVVKNHAKTPSAASAAVLLSDEQWDSGQQSAAIETLQQEISNNPDHPATIPARARLGARLIEQGDLDQAGQTLNSIVDDPNAGYLAPYALARLADIAKAQGKNEEAADLLEEAAGYEGSAFGTNIGERQRFADFQMPTEIDPPAPDPIDNAPDLSNPIELDPNQPSTGGTTGNPLLDGLSGAVTGDDAASDEAPAPEESPTPKEETPSPTPAEEPAPSAEEPAEPSSPEQGE